MNTDITFAIKVLESKLKERKDARDYYSCNPGKRKFYKGYIPKETIKQVRSLNKAIKLLKQIKEKENGREIKSRKIRSSN